MTELERIQSIKNNGGCHLQHFKEKYITYSMCVAAVEDDGNAICYVPVKYRTQEIYTLACQSNGRALWHVPEEFVTRELCESAVLSDGTSIKYVPEEYKTRELYILAAQNNPEVLQDAPSQFLDLDFFLKVIDKCGETVIKLLPKDFKNNDFYFSLIGKKPELLWYLPKSAHTSAICKLAIKEMGYESTAAAVNDNPELLCQLHTSLYDHDTCLAFVKSSFFKEKMQGEGHGFNSDSDYEKGLLYLQKHYYDHYSLKHILRWTDTCEIVLESYPRFLKYAKKSLLTYDMCLSAVKKDYWVFCDIPAKFYTVELCMAAFEQEPHIIEEFPEDCCPYEVYFEAVKKSGYILENTPTKYKTHELCLAAVKNVGIEIENVPLEILDEEICLAGLKNIGGLGSGILGKIPESLRSYSVCLEAVRVDSDSLAYVPKEHLTYELCLTAAHKLFSLQAVPKEFLTEELCTAAVEHSGLAFRDVPQEIITYKLCMLAINHGSDYAYQAIKRCPREMITQELCEAAVHKNILAIKYVPEEFVTEDMIVRVCGIAPSLLSDNFPIRYRTEAFIADLINTFPHLENRLKNYLQ